MTDNHMYWLTRLVLILAAAFFIYDLTVDFLEGEEPVHFVLELLVCTLIVAVLGAEITRTVHLRAELQQHRSEIAQLKSGIAEQVQAQLKRWKLSPSEAEIAWLIIKGYSFAEIASLRGVKEKTVRQQATAIYGKSGTANRNDFAAVFIEHLLTKPTHAEEQLCA